MLSTQTPSANAIPTRWSLSVSAETDAHLREYLGAQGMKKGDLSRFVEEAVRWRMLDNTTEQIRLRNADMSDAQMQTLIDKALDAARSS